MLRNETGNFRFRSACKNQIFSDNLIGITFLLKNIPLVCEINYWEDLRVWLHQCHTHFPKYYHKTTNTCHQKNQTGTQIMKYQENNVKNIQAYVPRRAGCFLFLSEMRKRLEKSILRHIFLVLQLSIQVSNSYLFTIHSVEI